MRRVLRQINLETASASSLCWPGSGDLKSPSVGGVDTMRNILRREINLEGVIRSGYFFATANPSEGGGRSVLC
jgi:hypothetical protein